MTDRFDYRAIEVLYNPQGMPCVVMKDGTSLPHPAHSPLVAREVAGGDLVAVTFTVLVERSQVAIALPIEPEQEPA